MRAPVAVGGSGCDPAIGAVEVGEHLLGVLAEAGRGERDPRLGPAEAPVRLGAGHPAVGRVEHRHEVLGDRLRVFEQARAQRLAALAGGGRHVRLVQAALPLLGAALAEAGLEDRQQLVAPLDAGAVGGEAGIVAQLGEAEGVAELRPEAVVGDAHRDITIGTGEDLVRDDVGAGAAHRAGRGAGGAPAREVLGDAARGPGDRRLQLRGLDERPAAGPFAHVERDEDRLQVGEGAAPVERRRAARELLPPACLAGDAGQPGRGLREPLVAGHAVHRPARAVGRALQVDQPRVVLAQQLVAEAEAAHHLGRAEVLDQHVGAADQAQRLRVALGILEVEHDAALAEVVAEEGVAGPAQHRRRAAHGVAARRLDLDRVGAEPAEVLDGDRPDGGLAEVEHAQAAQRPGPALAAHRLCHARTMRAGECGGQGGRGAIIGAAGRGP